MAIRTMCLNLTESAQSQEEKDKKEKKGEKNNNQPAFACFLAKVCHLIDHKSHKWQRTNLKISSLSLGATFLNLKVEHFLLNQAIKKETQNTSFMLFLPQERSWKLTHVNMHVKVHVCITWL